jgi:hypothetical protein
VLYLYLLWHKGRTAQTASAEVGTPLLGDTITAEMMVTSKNTAHLIIKTDWAVVLY